MMIQQLYLFADPRDTLLARALTELFNQDWYQEPIHRHTDGGALWHLLHCQGTEIDLEYCREWIKREHPELAWRYDA